MADEPNSSAETENPRYPGRTRKGTFANGHKLGGRPPGIPALMDALRKVMKENAEELSEKFMAMLREGDRTAWSLAMERAYPQPKEHKVEASVSSPEVDELVDRELEELMKTDEGRAALRQAMGEDEA